MARYQLDERGLIECPKTGKSVNPYKDCQSRGHGTVHGTVCDHYGFWHNEHCFVCRYTKERELRLQGNNGNYESPTPQVCK